MPIQTQRISQQEFGEIAYEVMRQVFEIHDEFGRFFNESIYQRELAARLAGILVEVPVKVSFGGYSKTYRLDVLKDGSGLFELKCADALSSKHRSQTINYLLLTDLGHAKIINMRPEKVEHEFVNCHLRLRETRDPKIVFNRWDESLMGAKRFQELLRALVGDWGSGLELPLYDAALCHFLIGQRDVPVTGTDDLGVQSIRMAESGVGFNSTAFKTRSEMFAVHARRLLKHTGLDAIFWANIRPNEIQFETICY